MLTHALARTHTHTHTHTCSTGHHHTCTNQICSRIILQSKRHIFVMATRYISAHSTTNCRLHNNKTDKTELSTQLYFNIYRDYTSSLSTPPPPLFELIMVILLNLVLQRPQATQGSLPQEHYFLKRPDTWIMAWRSLFSWEAWYMDHVLKIIMFFRGLIHGSWLEEHVLERPDTWIMAWRASCTWEAWYMDHGLKSIMYLRGLIHGSWLEDYVLQRPDTWIMAWRA